MESKRNPDSTRGKAHDGAVSPPFAVAQRGAEVLLTSERHKDLCAFTTEGEPSDPRPWVNSFLLAERLTQSLVG